MIDWVIDPVTAWIPNYIRYTSDLIQAIEQAMKAREDEITQWLKDNAPWQDRTGLTRRLLETNVFRDGLFIYIIMHHGTLRSAWFLEGRMWKGDPFRFSILAPALDYWGPIIYGDLVKITS
jgi:hypothetical protein